MSGRSRTRLYIGHIGRDVRTRDVERAFSKYGKIRDISLKSDFGFVEYYDARDAEDAVHYLDDTELIDSRITVEFARGSRDGPRDRYDDRDRGRGGAGGPAKDSKCFNCGKDGHWARDCPNGDWSNRCYRCGDKGHIQTECKNEKKGGGDRDRDGSRGRSRSPRKRSASPRKRSASPDRKRSASPKKNGDDRRSRSRTPPRSPKADAPAGGDGPAPVDQ